VKFEPRPPNDFDEFISVYFKRCQERFDKLRAIAGKWTFEDLIPGLSDFDTRFVVADGAGFDDWIAMSLAVGRVHAELAGERPHWARMLEHLPGINLTISEITEPAAYYPEFGQWTFYQGDASAIERIETYLAGRAWTARDEAFFLKKFATYFGPYQRGIDPPINMGRWENKYPLHSRFMHYFTPPVQAAVSLVKRRAVRGKFDALRHARELFDRPEVIDRVLDIVERHYEVPQYCAEPRLGDVERELDDYLRDVYAQLARHVTLIDIDPVDTAEQVRSRIAAMPADPVAQFLTGARFCRLMKGRLLFYGQSIDGFDSAWLIRNELGRIVPSFYEAPLRAYGQLRFGRRVDPREVLERLTGEVITMEDRQAVAGFVRTAGAPIPEGQERARARQVAAEFDPMLRVLEDLRRDMHRMTSESDHEVTDGPDH
jgi:hypothetical protein